MFQGRSPVLSGESEDSSIHSLALRESIAGCRETVMFSTLRTANNEEPYQISCD